MLLALVVMLTIWGLSVLIRRYWLRNCGKLLAATLAILIAFFGAFTQAYIAASFNESAGIETDGMGYLRNAFLTLCILLYVVYTSLRGKYSD